MSSVYQGAITVSIFGQSHSGGIGVVIDGLPAGEPIDLNELQHFLDRRAPGKNAWSTARKEADQPQILSGLTNGMTCGAPLCAILRNTDARSGDYDSLRDLPRPGHADFTAQMRYDGYQDAAGGGHFSGRLTAPLCVAGGICKQLLRRQGVTIGAHLLRVGEVCDTPYDPVYVTPDELTRTARRDFPVINEQAGARMKALIEQVRSQADSIGGLIECAAVGVPSGWGDPMMDGMENRIARLAFAVPAVKGIEFGAGFEAARLLGSQNNDEYYMDGDRVRTRTNHAGGLLGGITSGMPIVFRAAVKPTPSIGQTQQTVSLREGIAASLDIHGRHDPCIAPRAVVCMEAVLAIALTDALIDRRR